MGMELTYWALYELTDPVASDRSTHWLVRVVRPGSPGYLVQLCELADDLVDVRAKVVVDSALSARTGEGKPEVRILGWAAPLFPEDAVDSPLMALHGGELDVWVAWPRDEEPGDRVTLSLWTADSEEEFWAWVEDNEDDSTIETLARPAQRLRVRLWTPWDFQLWDSDPLLVPELDWLAGDAWEAWARHDEVDLGVLQGPRSPCPELREDEYRAIWVRRFDQLIEQRRVAGDLRARTWDLCRLASIDPDAMFTRMDALLSEIRSAGPESVDWVHGLVWSIEKVRPAAARDAWCERIRASSDPLEQELWAAYEEEALSNA